MKGENSSIKTLMKVLGAMISPKGLINCSYEQSLIFNIVVHLYVRWIYRWWYLFQWSILAKCIGPAMKSNIASSVGIGNLYLNNILLMIWLSVYILQLPSFSGVSNMGTAQGFKLSWMKLLHRTSSTCYYSACSTIFFFF